MPTMRPTAVSAVQAAVRRWNTELGPGLFGLGLSGGADSMALADAAIEICGARNLVAIHIDHGLSPTSGATAGEVAAWATSRGIASVVRAVHVSRGGSLEANAREARYAALDAVAEEIGAAAVWLAHTARDQAETVLMRVVRGTGPAGLAGIPARRGRYVRPLLELSRETIDAYVAARGLPVCSDPMNDDDRFARVRFRQRHLPALRAENPALDDALLRLAASAHEWQQALDEVAAPHAEWPLRCASLAPLPAAIRKRAYARALERAGLGYEAVHLERLDELVRRRSAGEVSIDITGARLVRSYDAIAIAGVPAAPGELIAPPGHEVRVWRPGDRMRPARLKGRSRKLSDLFIDLKVPRDARRTARVIVRSDDQEIVWAEYVGSAFAQPFQDI